MLFMEIMSGAPLLSQGTGGFRILPMVTLPVNEGTGMCF